MVWTSRATILRLRLGVNFDAETTSLEHIETQIQTPQAGCVWLRDSSTTTIKYQANEIPPNPV